MAWFLCYHDLISHMQTKTQDKMVHNVFACQKLLICIFVDQIQKDYPSFKTQRIIIEMVKMCKSHTHIHTHTHTYKQHKQSERLV